MRKPVSILISAALILIAVIFPGESYGFGVKIGLNLGSLYGDDAHHFENKLGPFFGVSHFIVFNDYWTIQPEILFTSKGGKYDDGDYQKTWSLTYIEIPFLAKYKFVNNYGENDFDIYFGPSAGVKLSAKSYNRVQNGEYLDDEELGNISKMDICMVFGVDYYYDFEKIAFTWDVRYTAGLTSVDGSPEGLDIKTGTITLAAGLVF